MAKIILIAVGALALAGILIIMLPQPTQSPSPQDSGMATSTDLGTIATSPTPTGSVAPRPTQTTSPKPVTTSGNRVITPAGGEQWVADESHTIQWANESLGNGYIVLLNTQTKAVVGYITPSLTLHQKTFAWNTKDVFLTRGSSQKKDVPIGTYSVKVVFEIGNKAAIESGAFTLIYPSQKTVSSQTFIIKNYVMAPAKLTVKRGDIIYIVNNDTISHKLSMSGYSPITIAAGETITFQTTPLTAGSYEFYSEQYTGLKAGITVL
ncbi:MAG: hypothetical protein AAB691_03605 [Patescibacteria group bacterium]